MAAPLECSGAPDSHRASWDLEYGFSALLGAARGSCQRTWGVILSLYLRSTSKNLERGKQLYNGKKKFNMDPKKGIEYLINNNLLVWEAKAVAEFLYKEDGLNKTAIGDFLGEREDMNIKILHAFVELHEFSDLNLVQALRQFLWSFRLPGEAQKIDRMMEAFATRYCICNPNVFQSTDTCYVLSFSIIMLNTSLHNPNVKDKPSLERFVAMNRGINNGGDLPQGLLEKLYDSIKNEPFKIPDDDGNDLTHTFFNPDREGWLMKLGGQIKTWKRRWFILTDSCLYYFEYTTDKEPRGIIPLENLCVREVDYPRKQPPPLLSTQALSTNSQLWLLETASFIVHLGVVEMLQPRGLRDCPGAPWQWPKAPVALS
ncbi:CYH2 protein, partial [Polypterus senegalus]